VGFSPALKITAAHPFAAYTVPFWEAIWVMESSRMLCLRNLLPETDGNTGFKYEYQIRKRRAWGGYWMDGWKFGVRFPSLRYPDQPSA